MGQGSPVCPTPTLATEMETPRPITAHSWEAFRPGQALDGTTRKSEPDPSEDLERSLCIQLGVPTFNRVASSEPAVSRVCQESCALPCPGCTLPPCG